MVYDYPSVSEPLRQGDIIRNIPLIDISMEEILVVDEGGNARKENWDALATSKDSIPAILPIRSVTGIIVSQDCDALSGDDVSLCEIRRFAEVYPPWGKAEKLKSRVSILTKHARQNLKWFYLPAEARCGFAEPMGVDFEVVFCLPRRQLEARRASRLGRLNPLADEHFREKLAEFFRRYPYDEWYPLDKMAFEEYKKENPEAKPFSWQ